MECCYPENIIIYYKSFVTKSKTIISQNLSQLILVEALLRVLYDKIQHERWGRVANTARGEAECCICHETPPQVLYFTVQHEYTVLLLICWVCVGGLRGGLLAHSADSVSKHDTIVAQCTMRLVCKVFQIII